MKIEPKNPAKKIRPYALLRPGYRSLGATSSTRGELYAEGPNRCYELLKSLEDHTVYVSGSLRGLLLTTGAQCWQATTWRGRITSLTLDGTKTKVSSLRAIISDTPDPFRALSVGLEWLSDLGISPGSLSSMAWSLWRSTLSDSLSIAFSPDIGRAALYGGRQEIREAKTFRHMVSIDITAAYPHAMGSEMAAPYASTLREVSKETTIDPERAGIAQAEVFVDPQSRFAPLPVRIADEIIQWQTGRISGVWTWRELDAARKIGAEVKVSRCWAPVREVQPFSEWWRVVLEGRSLVDGGSCIAKAISSSLWGLFGMVGDDRGDVRWTDDFGDRPVFVGKPPRKMPHAQMAHIASETASRVRVRMLLEGLAGPYAPVHIDTDGIIIRKSAPMPENSGDAPGQWRLKMKMPKVEIRAPQVYRYECSNLCGIEHMKYHYVTAGTSKTEAAELFERVPQTKIAIYGRDVVLPPGYSYDGDETERWSREARSVQAATFGRPMIGV